LQNTRVGQNNGKTTNTVYISLLIFCLQYNRIPSLNGLSTSFEQSLAELYTILLEEHVQVALEMLEVGICSSL
jgi:hypothetical protein